MKDGIAEFIQKVINSSLGKATANIETLQNSSRFKTYTQEQKLLAYNKHLELFQKACLKAIYPVANEDKVHSRIKDALDSKRVYKDTEFRIWENWKTKKEVLKAIQSDLTDDYENYYTAQKLAALIDYINRGEMSSPVERVPNEEFIKGKFNISLLPGERPLFKITKGKEVRKLTINEYIDAHLNNWEKAIDEQTERDKKLDVLQNARLSFSGIKYEYPVTEKEIERVFTRLNEVESYIKAKQGSPTKEKLDETYYVIENSEQFFSSPVYQTLKLTFYNQGYMYLKNDTGEIIAAYYTAEIATFFHHTQIEAWNRNEQRKEIINGKIFRKSFVAGFKKGVEIFNKKYPSDPNIIYANSEKLIPDILYQYYHYGYNGNSGWNFVKTTYTDVISHSLMFEYGMYSGLVSRVDEWRTDYPLLFKKFEDAIEKMKVEDNIPVPQSKSKKPKSILDIWKGTPEQYNKMIVELKKEYSPIGMPFLKEKESKQVWVFKGRGWVQYLQAFVWQCYKKDLLNKEIQLSAPQYQKMLSNTFSLPAFDSKPFKSLLSNQPKDNYLKAFRFLNSL